MKNCAFGKTDRPTPDQRRPQCDRHANGLLTRCRCLPGANSGWRVVVVAGPAYQGSDFRFRYPPAHRHLATAIAGVWRQTATDLTVKNGVPSARQSLNPNSDCELLNWLYRDRMIQESPCLFFSAIEVVNPTPAIRWLFWGFEIGRFHVSTVLLLALEVHSMRLAHPCSIQCEHRPNSAQDGFFSMAGG